MKNSGTGAKVREEDRRVSRFKERYRKFLELDKSCQVSVLELPAEQKHVRTGLEAEPRQPAYYTQCGRSQLPKGHISQLS